MIKISMFDNQWRIKIGDKDYWGEEWSFPDFNSFKIALDQLVMIKEKFGRLGEYDD